MKIDLTLEGMDELEEQLRGAIEGLLPSAAKGMEKGLARVEAQAKDLCPYDTGELCNSIHSKVEEGAAAVTGEVGSAKEYAGYVEMGTGPVGKESGGNGSGINASYSTGEYVFQRQLKNGKVVRFVTDGWVYPARGGGYRFTRGQPARPYLWPAWKANKQQVIADIRSAVKKGLR